MSVLGRVSRAFSWSIQLRVTVREMKEGPSGSAIMGFVSRVTPVQTALRNCTEGGPFGFGDQVGDPKPPQAAAVKLAAFSRNDHSVTARPVAPHHGELPL